MKRLGRRQSQDQEDNARGSLSVLTNQCFGKGTNAEPPGRGTDESFLMDSDKLIGPRGIVT